VEYQENVVQVNCSFTMSFLLLLSGHIQKVAKPNEINVFLLELSKEKNLTHQYITSAVVLQTTIPSSNRHCTTRGLDADDIAAIFSFKITSDAAIATCKLRLGGY